MKNALRKGDIKKVQVAQKLVNAVFLQMKKETCKKKRKLEKNWFN